jgi:2-haloacid dehalogenase
MQSLRAILFDTGGTVLDWHGSLVGEIRELGAEQIHGVDPGEFVNEWRRRSMRAIVGLVRPPFNMDDVHLRALDETTAHFGIPTLEESARKRLWQGWHRLRAWSDFPPALAQLRECMPIVSFTMLPLPLVMDVSRSNGLTWDAIVSCQMIGIYKPHREAYDTALAWLGLRAEEALMVACHNFDLNAAQDAGMQTAFVRRPLEWGPGGPPDPNPNRNYDLVVDTFSELVVRLFDQSTSIKDQAPGPT